MIFVLSIIVGAVLIALGRTSDEIYALADVGTIAAVAAPAVIGAFMPKKSAPSYQAPQGPNLYPEYQQQLLRSGFDPQSDLYRIAGEQQRAGINRQLARRGLANTGLGLNMQSAAAADLANKFAQSELERRALAYKSAVSPELDASRMRQADAQARYAADKAAYDQEMTDRGTFLGGVGTIGKEIGRYGQGQGWFSFGGSNPLPGTPGGPTGDEWYMRYANPNNPNR